ncbi:hypothetical protein Pan181_08220 [Aeoliella mucimassa]|uniref:Sialate O-acetylesterase domain-containing protein n=2 Tax=Aeoliella mucimassa TaxID=2527972 RepID=A0A518AIS4_9BACT|nr:hypothetical protein Pan181_08220 [Aeoliella mucimassa]
MIRSPICLLLLVSWNLLASLAVAETVDVYLLGGQSNMQGIAKVKNLPDDVPREIPHTYYFNGKEFEPLVLGKTLNSTRPGEFGPEVGFALETATAERPIYLIKYHASGMPLHHGWHGNQWQGGEPTPNRRNFYAGLSADDENQGTLYKQMTKLFRQGIDKLQADGHTPQVRGMLWMQGEQDSKHELSATTYAANLERLRDRTAEDLKLTEKLPLVFGQVLPHEPALPRFTHRTELRAQMQAADAESAEPEAIERVRMVSTDDCPLLGDTVHYDAEGQLRLGRKFAAAMAGELAEEHSP